MSGKASWNHECYLMVVQALKKQIPIWSKHKYLIADSKF